MSHNYSRAMAALEEKAQELDLRRQKQIANQVEVINRLQEKLEACYRGVERLHYADGTVHNGRRELHCATCHGEVWPCETAQLFGIGSDPSSPDAFVESTPKTV